MGSTNSVSCFDIETQQIVTTFSSVKVGAAGPPKSGCRRYWKACGRGPQLRCMSLKKRLATLIDYSNARVRCGPKRSEVLFSAFHFVVESKT